MRDANSRVGTYLKLGAKLSIYGTHEPIRLQNKCIYTSILYLDLLVTQPYNKAAQCIHILFCLENQPSQLVIIHCTVQTPHTFSQIQTLTWNFMVKLLVHKRNILQNSFPISQVKEDSSCCPSPTNSCGVPGIKKFYMKYIPKKYRSMIRLQHSLVTLTGLDKWFIQIKVK